MKIGLQIYSVRQAMTENPGKTLKAVKEMGYDWVEMAGGSYGLADKELLSLLKENGLRCASVHQSPVKFVADPEASISYVKNLEAQIAVIPMAPKRLESFVPQEAWEESISVFSAMAKAYHREGLSLLYHNHDFEVCQKEGNDYLLDRIFSAVPHLAPEFDTCWLSYGGLDPVKQILKYRGKITVVHLKDYRCASLPSKPIWQLLETGELEAKPEKRSLCGFSYQPVGCGVENWDDVVSASSEAGAEFLVVEQDESKERDPLEAVAISRRFIKERFGL